MNTTTTTTISQNIWDDAPGYTPAIWGVEASCRNMGAEWVNPAWSAAEVVAYWVAYWEFQKEALLAECFGS